MNKRFEDEILEFIYKGEKTPLSTGTIVVCLLCLLLVIVATFTQVNISHSMPAFDAAGELTFVNVSNAYVAQIPTILFIAAVLGPAYALITMILYILIGFFVWPVFALGGGLGYIKSGLFGYILGFILAVIPAGRLLEKKYSLKNIALATIIGVLCIHICAILYCILLALLKVVSFSYVSSAIHSIGGVKTLYDIVISFIFLLIARLVKMILWIAMRSSITKKITKKVRRDTI